LRLTSSLAAFIAVIAFTGWLTVRSFPLQAAPQEDSPSVNVHAGPLSLLHRTPVQYPKEALAKHIEGTVVLELSLSDTGTVTDARVLSGPEELRKAAIASVLEWHFAHDTQLPPSTEVSIDFKLPSAHDAASGPVAPPEELSRLDRLIITLGEPLKQKVQERVPLREGDRITQKALDELVAALKEVDAHLMIGVHPNADKTGSTIVISLDNDVKRIRVGGNVIQANLIRKVQPLYPPEAKRDGVQGRVRFTVIINKDGKIEHVTLVSGDPVLAQAAKEAVEQWVYKPVLLNGNPVEVVTTIDVNFTLAPRRSEVKP